MGKHRKNVRIKNWHTPGMSWPGAAVPPPRTSATAFQRNPSPDALEKFADRIREFFSPLGAAVEVTPDDVLLNGEPVYRDFGGPSSAIDQIGFRRYAAQFEQAVTQEVVARIPGAEARLHASRLDVFRDDHRLAWVCPTHAVVENVAGAQINGNFLLPGGHHWEEFRRRLGAASAVTILTQLPATASSDQHARALTASMSIRDQRRRNFERAMVTVTSLTTAGRRIVFSPTSITGPVEAPFLFTDGDQTIAAPSD